MSLFYKSKIEKEEKKKFLEEISNNVKRQIIIDETNIRFFEREKLRGSNDRILQIQKMIEAIKNEKEELERKLDVIKDELEEIK